MEDGAGRWEQRGFQGPVEAADTHRNRRKRRSVAGTATLAESAAVTARERPLTAVPLGSVFQWGSSLNLLGANNSDTVLILFEHVMSVHYGQQVAAVQLTPKQLSIAQFSSGAHLALQSDIHVKGVCATKVSVGDVAQISRHAHFSLCSEADDLFKVVVKRERSVFSFPHDPKSLWVIVCFLFFSFLCYGFFITIKKQNKIY